MQYDDYYYYYDYSPERQYSNGECGIPGVEPNIFMRIVGGEEAEPNSWPWHSKIKRRRASGRYSFICGGSLIDARYCATAAHCV